MVVGVQEEEEEWEGEKAVPFFQLQDSQLCRAALPTPEINALQRDPLYHGSETGASVMRSRVKKFVRRTHIRP